ncbi:MAG TPA: ATP-binding cassette domain-containing protein [Methanosarcinaceae archaeon]|nr:ATP-binding cassette domain-containing protein [Methanosarcinaceae archaeon]
MTILKTNNLKYSYPDGTVAVDGVDIDIKNGQKITFLGPNGSGKSTLFLLLNGTLKPQEGEIQFNGNALKYNPKSLRNIRKNVGIVFQNSDDQIFAPTVHQDVAFGPVNLDFPKDRVENNVNNTLEYVGLSHLKDKPPHHLSGGQKKRVAIAGVVAMEPEVIILDEPLSNLDPVGADEILDLLNEFNYNGKTIIISTHDVDLAYRWSDYVYLISGGKVIGEGVPDKVFENPELLKVAKLKQPATLEIYHEIERRGLAVIGEVPKTVPELVDALKPPELMWVSVPPGTQEGDTLNLGVMYGEYAQHCPYEAVNAKVLHIHDDGRAVVEMMRKGIRAGCIMIYDMDSYDHNDLIKVIDESEIDIVGAMGTMCKNVAERDGVLLEITGGVIDKSILMALCGKRCLVLTNGGMIKHSMKRIKDYVEKSGIDLSVSVVGVEKA